MNRSTPGLPVHQQLSRVYSNPCPSSRWCHPAISSSVIPFSSCPQSLPASGSSPGCFLGQQVLFYKCVLLYPSESCFNWTLSKRTLGLPCDSRVKNSPAVQGAQEMGVQSLGWGESLEEGMATHSSILAWRIPWTEEPGGLQSMGSQSPTRLSVSTEHQMIKTIKDPHYFIYLFGSRSVFNL